MREKSRRGEGYQLEQQLVDAATKLLLDSHGFKAPSLRAVARECGVSPSAVYLHFPSQLDLSRRVVAEQFENLRRALGQADDPAQPAVRRLELLGVAYAGWGVDNPGGYQLLFDAPDVDAPPGESWAPGIDLLELAVGLFAELGRDDALSTRLATTLWASWHGLISLRRNNPTAPWMSALTDDVVLVVNALTRL
jgi:AcrR family transcriptional regulator